MLQITIYCSSFEDKTRNLPLIEFHVFSSKQVTSLDFEVGYA